MNITGTSSAQVPESRHSLWQRVQHIDSRWLMVVLFVAALAIRVFQIGSVPFMGDETFTPVEAQTFTNYHALSYFLVLRVWMLVSDSVVWMRLLSALLGAGAVILMWQWVNVLRGRKIATAAAVLLMLSPFAVEYSQEIRFYAMWLPAVMLMWRLYLPLVINPHRRSPLYYVALAASALIVMTTHLFGVMTVALVGLHWLVSTYPRFSKPVQRVLIGLTVLVLVGSIVVLFTPAVLQAGFDFVNYSVGAGKGGVVDYHGGRGVTYITTGKLGLNFVAFAVGQYTFPLTPLAFTALVICAVLLALGMWRLFRHSNLATFTFPLILGLLPVLALYLVVDALWPPTSSGSISPRYLIPTLPIFVWLLVEGCLQVAVIVRRPRSWIIALIVVAILNVGGLLNLYFPTWHFAYKGIATNAIFDDVKSHLGGQSLAIIAGPRGDRLPVFYLNDIHDAEQIGSNLITIPATIAQFNGKQQAVLISADYHPTSICEFSQLLGSMAQWREVTARVDYPLFVYSYEIGDSSLASNSPITPIPLPRSVYGLEFADLKLPAAASLNGKALTIGGMQTLPTCSGQMTIQRSLATPIKATSLVLLSDLTRADKVPDGTLVSTLTIETSSGEKQSFEITKGHDTQSWDATCANGAACQTALSWHKRFALVGNSAYPGAYNDFQANIFGVTLTLPTETEITGVQIKVAETGANLHVWGLYAQR